jgi:hypothetical protein
MVRMVLAHAGQLGQTLLYLQFEAPKPIHL